MFRSPQLTRLRQIMGWSVHENIRTRINGVGREALRQLIKRAMIAARREGNDDRAADLSEAKQILKTMERPHCIVCGVPIVRGSLRCKLHYDASRRQPKLPERSQVA